VGSRMRKLLVLAAVLTVAAACPPRQAHGRSKRWSWTPEELKQIDALRKQVVRDGRTTFHVLEAGRFNIRTDISPRFAAEVSLFMDMFYDGYCRIVLDMVKAAPPAPPKGGGDSAGNRIPFPVKPTVVIYSSREQYVKMFPDRTGGRFTWQWNGKGRWTRFHIYSYVPDLRWRSFASFRHSILMHEGTHCMLQAMAGTQQIPPWLNEGLAQVVESLDLRALLRGRIRHRYPPHGNVRVLRLLGDGWYSRGPSLERLLKIEEWNTDRMGNKTRYRYAIAWGFMQFLLSTDDGHKVLRKVLGRLVRRRRPLLSRAECQAIEPKWHRHFRKYWN